MAVLLPLLVWGIVWYGCRCFATNWRETILRATIIWTGILLIQTELLSLFNLLTAPALILSWSVVIGISFVIVRRYSPPPLNLSFSEYLQPRYLVVLIGIYIALIALVAIVYPPSNWDSHTYHMPRVMHWQQNHTLAHYPTLIDRQLYQPPLAEIFILQTYLLSNSDYFANFIQFFSMLGCLLAVSLLAQQFGLAQTGQWLAVFICLMLPMGILQASSTQNDYVVAFWILCLAVFIVCNPADRLRWDRLVLISLSSGFALLTKGTAYIYVAPFALWLGIMMLRVWRWRAILVAAVMALLVLACNLGHFARNQATFGSPITSSESYANLTLSPASFTSVALRNISLHLMDVKPFIQLVQTIHTNILYYNIDDPRTTFAQNFSSVSGGWFIQQTFQEDFAGNMIHFLLFVGICVLYGFWRTRHKHPVLDQYLLCFAVQIILFCLLFRWQQWGSRLQLAFFIQMSPFLAWGLLTLLRRTWLVYGVVGVLSIGGAAVMILGSRPLSPLAPLPLTLTRLDLYTFERYDNASELLEAVQTIADTGCNQIGFVGSPDTWEYPLWTIAQQIYKEPYRIEHTIAQDQVSPTTLIPAPLGLFNPCALVVQDPFLEMPTLTTPFGEFTFHKVWIESRVSIFFRSSD